MNMAWRGRLVLQAAPAMAGGPLGGDARGAGTTCGKQGELARGGRQEGAREDWRMDGEAAELVKNTERTRMDVNREFEINEVGRKQACWKPE